ncbi:MAG: hypothetical protein JNM28_12080 [Armatimonadetes bacterium]|nr:hypothetical protein [Armatimonadota bacterium]
MASRSYFSRIQRSQTPGTIGLIIASLAMFIILWIPQFGIALTLALAFGYDLGKPWQLLTYPFVEQGGFGLGLIFYAIILVWFYNFAGEFERKFGLKSLLAHFFVASACCGIVAALVQRVAPSPIPYLSSFWLPTTFFVVTVCGMDPNRSMSLMGFPLTFRTLAILELALCILSYGMGNPIFGIAVSLPLALGWFYGRGQLGKLYPGMVDRAKRKKHENREFDEFRGKVRNREKERAERERLRQLFEGSIDQDPPGAER